MQDENFNIEVPAGPDYQQFASIFDRPKPPSAELGDMPYGIWLHALLLPKPLVGIIKVKQPPFPVSHEPDVHVTGWFGCYSKGVMPKVVIFDGGRQMSIGETGKFLDDAFRGLNFIGIKPDKVVRDVRKTLLVEKATMHTKHIGTRDVLVLKSVTMWKDDIVESLNQHI